MTDLAAVQQLLAGCWAHHSRDTEMLSECFAKDLSLFGLQNRDAVVARYAGGCERLTARRRGLLTNLIILEDGDTHAVGATGRSGRCKLIRTRSPMPASCKKSSSNSGAREVAE